MFIDLLTTYSDWELESIDDLYVIYAVIHSKLIKAYIRSLNTKFKD